MRVHTDGEADHLSQSVQAVAFTSGADIFFRQGAYNPSSQQGLHLLAHEAAHTVQQARGPVVGTPHPGGVSISDPADRFERAAEASAASVSAGAEGVAPAAQRTAAPTVPVQAVPLQRHAYTTSSMGSVPIQRWALNTAKEGKSIPNIPWSNTQSIETLTSGRPVLFFHDATDSIVIKAEDAPIGMTVLVKGLHQQVHGTPTIRTKDVTGDRATILTMIDNAGLTGDASWTTLGNSGRPDSERTDTGAPIVDANDTPAVKARKLQKSTFAKLPKVHAMALAAGQSAEDLMKPAKQGGDKSTIRGLLMDPARLQRLGMITAVDLFLENPDRVIQGNVGNWFVNAAGAVTLIDNLDDNARGLWKAGSDTDTGPLNEINSLKQSELSNTATECVSMLVRQLNAFDKTAKKWADEAHQSGTRRDFMQEHFLTGLTKGRARIIALYAVKGFKKTFSGKTQAAKKGLKKLQAADKATCDWDTGSERYWERLKARARWLKAN